MQSKLIFIKWGKGHRRFKVKDFSQYEKIGKVGRFNLYQRKKKKKVKKESFSRITKRRVKKVSVMRIPGGSLKLRKRGKKVSKKEAEIIQRIKGGVSEVTLQEEKRIEKDLLRKVQLLPTFDKYKYVDRINPKHKIISNGKVYGSFHALDNDKRDIYLDLIGILIEGKNQKFKDKLYSLREPLLKDGIVIEVDLYGVLHEKNMRKKYFGTLALVGLMVEKAGFIESEMIGWSGENRQVISIFDSLTRNAGGEKCYWMKNNLALDTAHITITDVQLRLNYA